LRPSNMEVSARSMMVLVAFLPWLGAFVLSHLLWSDLQRAEYLADRLGAGLSGTGAAVSSLQKLHLAGVSFLRTGFLYKDYGADVLGELKKRLEDTGILNQADLLLLGNGEDWRLNSTHPPTASRINMLQAHSGAVNQPALILSDPFFEALEQEL